jgi:hypothetical protein
MTVGIPDRTGQLLTDIIRGISQRIEAQIIEQILAPAPGTLGRNTMVGQFFCHRPTFFAGPGGALMCNCEVHGLTHKLSNLDTAAYYGSEFFVGESMCRATMRWIASQVPNARFWEQV